MGIGGNTWILGVDTSRKGIHLSLLRPDGSDERFRHNELARGEALVAEVTLLLQENHLALNEIHSVIVTLGPGSFTGLRTGIAFCQGLCSQENRKLFGVSSLQMFSVQAPQDNLDVAYLLFARPGHWYMSYQGQFFLSDQDVLTRIASVKTVIADRERPLEGRLSEWNGSWHKLDTEWQFSKVLPILSKIEPSLVQHANYLQPSYAER
jgi:tRNA threonylcarbamoyladenosine biosynthesis protein TsaB